MFHCSSHPWVRLRLKFYKYARYRLIQLDYLATSTSFQTSSDFFDLNLHVLFIRFSYAIHLVDMFLMIILSFAGFFLLSQAYPADLSLYSSTWLGKRDGQVPEWTAMGDSYASGVGAGPQPADDTNRCFRFPNAYPVVVQAKLQPNPSKFNNVACSGNTFQQIRENELLDKPKDDGKNGIRPAWGEAPEFVTMTMGGNDIGILNLISTCILSFKLWGMDCEEVIQYGHDTINSQQFKDDLNGLIGAVVEKGRGTSVGDRFKIFVVGYAQFFNQETTQCNDISFKPVWNLLPAQMLTVERRTAMNGLALALNKALAVAVDGFKDKGVYWVDYDQYFNGHRFCDREEPKPDDPETYFFNYYTKDDPKSEKARKIFEKMPTYQASVKGGKDGAFKTDEDFINALAEATQDDPEAESVLSDTVRMFHPSTRGHEQIRDIVLNSLNDHNVLA